MKTIRVNDDIHQQLTCMLGELMAKTGKPQTFNDVIEELINQAANQKREKTK